ncbi:hypothetical protein FACS1894211_08070 [Clostridia bacterium]|nr:hypothetical protein FACS1894211_08070 [Clostridia bacterium]
MRRRYNLYNVGFSARGHLRRHALHYCFLAVCFAVGIAVGCTTAGKLAKTMTVLDVNYLGMIRVLNVNARFGTIFWNRIFGAALFFLAVAFFGNFLLTLPLCHALMIWRGYVVGLNCAVSILFYGAGGLVSALVWVVPHQLILAAALCPLIALSCSLRIGRRGYRGGFDLLFCLRELYPQFLCAYLIVVVLALVEGLLLPMFGVIA